MRKRTRILGFSVHRVWQDAAFLIRYHGRYIPVFYDHRGAWVNHQEQPLNLTPPGVTTASNRRYETLLMLAKVPKAESFPTERAAVERYPMTMFTREPDLDDR